MLATMSAKVPWMDYLFVERIISALDGPLVAAKPNDATFRFEVVAGLFDASTSYARKGTLRKMLSLIRRHKTLADFFVLKKLLRRKLTHWVTAWDLTILDSLVFYRTVALAARNAGDDEEAYYYFLESLFLFTPRHQNEVSMGLYRPQPVPFRLMAEKMAFDSLTLPFVWDFPLLLSNEGIRYLRYTNPSLHALLKIYATGNLEMYLKFHSSTPLVEILEGNLIPYENVLFEKLCILTLCYLAENRLPHEPRISFKEIGHALLIPPSHAAQWIDIAIQHDLLEGKIDEDKQTFTVKSSQRRTCTEAEWRQIHDYLQEDRDRRERHRTEKQLHSLWPAVPVTFEEEVRSRLAVGTTVPPEQ